MSFAITRLFFLLFLLLRVDPEPQQASVSSEVPYQMLTTGEDACLRFWDLRCRFLFRLRLRSFYPCWLMKDVNWGVLYLCYTIQYIGDHTP